MKSVLRLFVSAIVVFSLAGCYTELATVERQESDIAYDSDTSYDEGNTTINNHYYLDDDYRQSRLRVSFNYYYPTYSSWISSYYHSYFNDYYWGMSYRPSWYYDPFYTYYPPYGWCYYPSPYYHPWYPYYPPIAYYPGYYSMPVYANNPATPNRPRTDGPTRDPQPEDRLRPIPGTTPTTEPPITSTDVRPTTGEARPIETSGRKPEQPWWERLNTERPTKLADEARPIDNDKGNKPPRENVPGYNPPTLDRPNSDGEARPTEHPKNSQPTYTPPKNKRPGSEDRPVERPKRGEPKYSPPVKQSVPKDEARPVERPRETRQPSYNPPPQSTPPQSAPPRSSGGSSSSGGSGRKRD